MSNAAVTKCPCHPSPSHSLHPLALDSLCPLRWSGGMVWQVWSGRILSWTIRGQQSTAWSTPKHPIVMAARLDPVVMAIAPPSHMLLRKGAPFVTISITTADNTISPDFKAVPETTRRKTKGAAQAPALSIKTSDSSPSMYSSSRCHASPAV